MQESVLVDKNVKYHPHLNPVAWSNSQLRDNIKHQLLTIADQFIEFLNLPNLPIKDIVLTGSNANYNWTQYSDFDVHVIVDYTKVSDSDVALELFNTKKELWKMSHNISIKNHDVELYVEDTATPPVSQGVYSLVDAEWLRQPSYNKPAIDDAAIEAKVLDLMISIDSILDSDSDNVELLTKLIEKIRKMRKSGLAENGEFSVENLAFKIIRNEGYLSKLYTARREAVDRSLTIESV